MSAVTQTFKVAGPTYAISVAATQLAALAILPSTSETCSFASFINRGATDVCIVTNQALGTPATPALVFPVSGTPTVPNSFVLPASMTAPMIVSVPSNGFDVSAIGSGAGPSIVYITPVIPF